MYIALSHTHTHAHAHTHAHTHTRAHTHAQMLSSGGRYGDVAVLDMAQRQAEAAAGGGDGKTDGGANAAVPLRVNISRVRFHSGVKVLGLSRS